MCIRDSSYSVPFSFGRIDSPLVSFSVNEKLRIQNKNDKLGLRVLSVFDGDGGFYPTYTGLSVKPQETLSRPLSGKRKDLFADMIYSLTTDLDLFNLFSLENSPDDSPSVVEFDWKALRVAKFPAGESNTSGAGEYVDQIKSKITFLESGDGSFEKAYERESYSLMEAGRRYSTYSKKMLVVKQNKWFVRLELFRKGGVGDASTEPDAIVNYSLPFTVDGQRVDELVLEKTLVDSKIRDSLTKKDN